MLLAKLKDPGSFSNPYLIGNTYINRSLCDLRSSVSLMPLSMCVQFELGEMRPTTISSQLANHSIKCPVGVLEYVPIKVGDLYVEVDFVILEIEEVTHNPIIFGMPFLATTGCRIDVKNGKLSFDVGDDHVDFNLFKASKFPSISNECNKIDVVNGFMWETVSNLDSNDPLEHLMLNDSATKDATPKLAIRTQLLEASPPIPPSLGKVEPLKVENKPLSDAVRAHEVELKSLRSSLRYEFL